MNQTVSHNYAHQLRISFTFVGYEMVDAKKALQQSDSLGILISS